MEIHGLLHKTRNRNQKKKGTKNTMPTINKNGTTPQQILGQVKIPRTRLGSPKTTHDQVKPLWQLCLELSKFYCYQVIKEKSGRVGKYYFASPVSLYRLVEDHSDLVDIYEDEVPKHLRKARKIQKHVKVEDVLSLLEMSKYKRVSEIKDKIYTRTKPSKNKKVTKTRHSWTWWQRLGRWLFRLEV